MAATMMMTSTTMIATAMAAFKKIISSASCRSGRE